MPSVVRRANVYVGVLAVSSCVLLAQATCLPASLLDPVGNAGDAGLTAQDTAGNVLTIEELTELVQQIAEREVVRVVFLNPVPGPKGSPGEPGAAGPPGPAGPEGATPAPALVGEVRMWAGQRTMPPAGWLPCDGQTLKIAEYPELFNAIGLAWNSDISDPSVFQLPDLRDRSPMGSSQADSGGAPLTTVEGNAFRWGGNAAHVLTVEQLPTHSHSVTHAHTLVGAAAGTVGSSIVQLIDPAGPTVDYTIDRPLSLASGPVGGSEPHPVLDPYFAITYIIYVGEPKPATTSAVP